VAEDVAKHVAKHVAKTGRVRRTLFLNNDLSEILILAAASSSRLLGA
jgi:hypothetical protein